MVFILVFFSFYNESGQESTKKFEKILCNKNVSDFIFDPTGHD